MSDADGHNEHDGGDVPSNDRDRLCYGERKTMGHTQEEGEVRNNRYHQGDSFDCDKPRIINFDNTSEAISLLTMLNLQ